MMRLIFCASLLCAGLSVTRADDTPVPADDVEPRVDTSATSTERQFDTVDRLQLDTTSITGNQELPKVLYIVPWKKPLAGDLPAPPLSSLLEEVLAPVDREVFRRHISYFRDLNGPQADQPNEFGPTEEE